MGVAVAILMLFNLFDAYATYRYVSIGWAYEVNPFMAWCIAHGWVTFFVVKIFIVAFGCGCLLVLYQRRKHDPRKRRVLYGATGLLIAAYTFLCGWHVYFYFAARS
jgi:hypothetical protein